MKDLIDRQEFPVRLDVFEGPLDLLLYLIKKDEIDIYDIPIERITRQYMEYLDVMKLLDLNIAGEFIVMASTLMMIKSRMLLPVEDRRTEDEEEGEDPRWDLVRQLVAYKKYKDAAGYLERMEDLQTNVIEPEPGEIEVDKTPDAALRDVSLFDLISTFNEILARAQTQELKEIFVERFTVSEKVEYILKQIQTGAHRVSMLELFRPMRSRREMICTFLAILELIRLKHIRAVQEAAFHDIIIMKQDDPGPDAAEADEAATEAP